MNHGMRAIIAARRERYLATDAQKLYLRRLANEAFARLVPTGIDVNHLERLTRTEACEEIDRLKKLKEAGWPRT